MGKILTIAIPTLKEREDKFNILFEKLQRQSNGLPVQIISDPTGRELSIGLKRDALYRKSKGKYTVQIDDDDDVSDSFVTSILEAADTGPDCISYYERCTIDGVVKKSMISMTCNEWKTFVSPVDGLHFRRTPFFKVPIKTELCLKVGVNDLRWGEDHDFAKRIYPLIRTEMFINKEMYFYTANSLTPKQQKERYGL